MKEDRNKSKFSDRDWVAYYEAVAGRPPRKTLLLALNRFDAEKLENASRLAVDLGCGDGRDTVELRRRGWSVLGIDGEKEAISRLRSLPDIDISLLSTQVMGFETLELPPALDLINASFCLPFCAREEFPGLWAKILAALRTGGRFCGYLFGDRDSWITKKMIVELPCLCTCFFHFICLLSLDYTIPT
ncbi:MAG: class I SAM-dependent methyltransferase [Hormoscilla sp. GUM202]|nr:class I SAM-dependent methyltransferase [Hormoscilla sp. GUM202]